jgi:transcriptional regulator with XRE-family HTH domain
MAQQCYAKRACELLTFLGMEQAEVTRRLGVSQTNVSFWWTGRRPVPRKHIPAFLALVRDKIREDRGAHRAQIVAMLDAWFKELYVRVGICHDEIRYELEVLKSAYATVDPLSLDREERRRLWFAARMLMLHLGYLDEIEQPLPESLDAEAGTARRDPEDCLEKIMAYYRLMPKSWMPEGASGTPREEGE